MELEKQITQENIARLMDIFYTKIRKNEHLADIFNSKIGYEDEQWEHHKEKIGRFWRQMLLGENVFEGQPLKKHLDLPPFPREFFGVWLELFEESLKMIYEEEVAQEFLIRAQMIAQRFQVAIYDMQIHS
ncbi:MULTISPECIES: group III truncated hemoglobin [unclassified Helicobacter]|uniref:group III truncated hemoglobin n=1 Tax=unclassified Helicobacter TaxID=2593540 RepID=UPI000CF1BF72|nr:MULTISPECIES: group III truncated hemoglobin [unclassified Helicobacter]